MLDARKLKTSSQQRPQYPLKRYGIKVRENNGWLSCFVAAWSKVTTLLNESQFCKQMHYNIVDSKFYDLFQTLSALYTSNDSGKDNMVHLNYN